MYDKIFIMYILRTFLYKHFITIKDSFLVSANRKIVCCYSCLFSSRSLKNLENILNKCLKTLKSYHRTKDFRIKTPEIRENTSLIPIAL